MAEKKERLYFAYGSNINLEQMAQRCPDAVRLMVRYFRDGTCSSFDKEFKR